MMPLEEVIRNYLDDKQTLEELRDCVALAAFSAKGAEEELCDDIISALAFLDDGHTDLPQFRRWLSTRNHERRSKRVSKD